MVLFNNKPINCKARLRRLPRSLRTGGEGLPSRCTAQLVRFLGIAEVALLLTSLRQKSSTRVKPYSKCCRPSSTAAKPGNTPSRLQRRSTPTLHHH
eukprot:3546469-Amphidinium_carterae.1